MILNWSLELPRNIPHVWSCAFSRRLGNRVPIEVATTACWPKDFLKLCRNRVPQVLNVDGIMTTCRRVWLRGWASIVLVNFRTVFVETADGDLILHDPSHQPPKSLTHLSVGVVTIDALFYNIRLASGCTRDEGGFS